MSRQIQRKAEQFFLQKKEISKSLKKPNESTYNLLKYRYENFQNLLLFFSIFDGANVSINYPSKAYRKRMRIAF
jgi:hypothetical protein